MNKVKAIKVTKRSAEKCKEHFALQSMEIVGLAQAIIKRRLERALFCEEELDCLMQTLLHHAEVCEDKGKSKTIISKFDSLRIEDITKLASLIKSMGDRELTGRTEIKEGEQVKIKFEDLYG